MDANFRKKLGFPTVLRRSLEMARIEYESADLSVTKSNEMSQSMMALRIRETVRDHPPDHSMYALDTCDAATDWTGVRRYMDCCNENGVRPKMQVRRLNPAAFARLSPAPPQVIQQLLNCAHATTAASPAPPAIILDSYDLRPADAAAVAAAARQNRSVVLLSLSSNPAVGDAGAAAVCAGLGADASVEALAMARCGLTHAAGLALHDLLLCVPRPPPASRPAVHVPPCISLPTHPPLHGPGMGLSSRRRRLQPTAEGSRLAPFQARQAR